MEEAKDALKSNGIDYYYLHRRNLDYQGVVNVKPEDKEETIEALKEAGYELGYCEELLDNTEVLDAEEDGEVEPTPFTRIKFLEPGE